MNMTEKEAAFLMVVKALASEFNKAVNDAARKVAFDLIEYANETCEREVVIISNESGIERARLDLIAFTGCLK